MSFTISDIRYKAMSENMEKEYEYLVTKRKEIQDKLSETDKTKKNADTKSRFYVCLSA